MRQVRRFQDLKAAGIVKNWPHLKRLVEHHGFPPGRKLSDNIRAWFDEEIDPWIDSRPLAGQREEDV